MILFRIFHIRKMIKEARENPSKLAGDEAKDALWGIFIVPLIIIGLVVAIFFIIGYTSLFGFQFGFFKLLFWISLIIGGIILSIIYKVIKSISRKTVIYTKSVIKKISLESDGEVS